MKQLTFDDIPAKANKKDSLYGGVEVGTLTARTNDILSMEAKMATIKGELSGVYKQLEESGTSKAPYKLAKKLDDMEDDKARDFLTGLQSYLFGLGTFHRLGLFLVVAKGPELEVQSGAPAEPEETNIAKIMTKNSKPVSAAAAH